MSSSRSQTSSPRISPLPRLESYASYSSSADRLWDGHDPVRLAAREASIRARMVARARARASEGVKGGTGSDAGSEVLADAYGRSDRGDGSMGRTTPIPPTTPTERSPLKPLILASSSTLPPHGQQPVPSSNTTPRSVSTSGRRTITRRPSAVELKYSPISSPQTPISISFVAEQGKERRSSSPRASMTTGRVSDTWSYRSSGYLSPSPSSFSTLLHQPRSSVSPNLLSPSYATSNSPTSALCGSSKPPRAPIQPTSPDLWDDEEQWKRVSTYLVDPYGPSTDVSPANSLRQVPPRGKERRDADQRRHDLGVMDLRLPFGLEYGSNPVTKQRADRGMSRKSNESPNPLLRAPHSGSTSPSATGAEYTQRTPLASPQSSSDRRKNVPPARDTISTASSGSSDPVHDWEVLPPLPVEPPKRAVLLERARSKGGKTAAEGLVSPDLMQEGSGREQVSLPSLLNR